jgi:isopenicillin N synthase-like dioxygenase
MFQIINHGVSQAIINICQIFATFMFVLPIQKKMKVKRFGDGSFHGYGTRSSGMKSNYTNIWFETFYVMDSPLLGNSFYYATKIWGLDGNIGFN